jgi:hypothetical protein
VISATTVVIQRWEIAPLRPAPHIKKTDLFNAKSSNLGIATTDQPHKPSTQDTP